MYSARDLAEHFNRTGEFPPRLFVAEERAGSLVFYLNAALCAELTEGRLQFLPTDPPTPLRPGDVVAVKDRNLSKAEQWLDLDDSPYQRVGQYRLYRLAKPQAGN